MATVATVQGNMTGQRAFRRRLRERLAPIFSTSFQPACPVLSCQTSLRK